MKMTFSEIIEARKKILANAEQLIEEAELLFKNKKFPRTFSLSHLACEELAKLPMLNTATLNILIGEDDDNNWQKINRRLVTHRAKLKTLATIDYFWDNNMGNNADVNKYKEEIRLIPVLDGFKNGSLYAGFFKDTFLQPSDLISEQLSGEMLHLAKNRFVQYQKYEFAFFSIISSDEGKQRLAEDWRKLNKIGEDMPL